MYIYSRVIEALITLEMEKNLVLIQKILIQEPREHVLSDIDSAFKKIKANKRFNESW
tara:strand:- start:1367 stop:1537 length:171 start_codon:yes stop_codon:yes gene_type:complete